MKFKKASYDLGAMLYYIMISIFILVFIMFTYLFITNGFVLNISYLSRGAESSVLINRVLYSQNCFAYYDTLTMRTHPLIIDVNKFNQENFEKCLDSDKIESLVLKQNNGSVFKILRNPLVDDAFNSGEKPVFLYDKKMKPMILEIRFRDDT